MTHAQLFTESKGAPSRSVVGSVGQKKGGSEAVVPLHFAAGSRQWFGEAAGCGGTVVRQRGVAVSQVWKSRPISDGGWFGPVGDGAMNRQEIVNPSSGVSLRS